MNLFNQSNNKGYKTDFEGEISGTLANILSKSFSEFNEFETYLKAIRTWGAQLSGILGGISGLHLSIYSTRPVMCTWKIGSTLGSTFGRVIAGLFFFLLVDSELLPRKENGVGYASLSRYTDQCCAGTCPRCAWDNWDIMWDSLGHSVGQEMSRQNSKRQPDKRVYVEYEIKNFNSLYSISITVKNDSIMQSESNKKRCGLCGQGGHNSRTCSQK
ncbi:11118_t:CDS:2 [Funneliformis mosseae]|uniref:11118_t:CDS:1 n=1 Tax=Funneliformis mosseae TaxID=27381 RepID=A0A9N8VDH2_FUNMO|nr:11118_t:CDS:2 [Funneliformis mosseae]